MKIITFNAGLLSVSFFGGLRRFEPAGWVEERLNQLPNALFHARPDLLLLQEVYSQQHKRRLAQALSHWLPYASYSTIDPRFRLLPDSLMILSRYPLREARFVRFKAGRWDERLLDTKGFMMAHLDETPLGPMVVANVHTTAGVFTHPEHPKIDRVRSSQIHQVADCVIEAASTGVKAVIAGDLNCGPAVPLVGEPPIAALKLKGGYVIPAEERVSVGNYRQLLARGFVDTFQSLGLENKPTWSPTSNPLNKGGEHAEWGCPAQRIDHVWVRPQELRATSGSIFMEAAVVPVQETKRVPPSDHYGYWVDLAPNAT